MRTNGSSRTLQFLAAAAVAAFCVHSFSGNKADVDLWGNVGFVKSWPGTEGFRFRNTFSFTEPDRAWVNHEWLAEYVFHRVYTLAGDPGLILLKLLMGCAIVSLVVLSMRRCRVSGPLAFLFLLLMISTISYGFAVRPHHFTYLLYAALFFFLQTRWRPWLLVCIAPFLGTVWANLHGAFFTGILLLVVYAVCEGLRGLKNREDRAHAWLVMSAAGLFAAGTLLNPYGIRLWNFVLHSAARPRPYLSEWAPFNPLSDIAIHPDFVVLVVLSAAGILFARKRDVTGIVILGLTLVAALLMRRSILLFAITAGFVVPQHLEQVTAEPLRRLAARLPAWLTATALAAFAGVSIGYAATFNKTDPFRIEVKQADFPVDVVELMQRNNVQGNALIFFDWAEQCIWQLYPRCRVFLDGRFESAYSGATIDDYFNFLYRDGDWKRALGNYDTDIVLIHRGNPAYAAMAALPDWSLICQTEVAALFVKTARHADLVARARAGTLAIPPGRNHAYFP